MAQRAWHLAPDEVKTTVTGQQIPVVSRRAQIEAVIDGVAVMDRVGGTLGVVGGRAPTGFPKEMVTTEFVVTWTGLTAHRQQPEQPLDLTQSSIDEPDEVNEEPYVVEVGAEVDADEQQGQ